MARAAAIDSGEWTGAGSASVAGGARLWATPRLDRDPSAAPARGGWRFAALVSLIVHAAIVVAAVSSFGPPQPTGAPDAIAVELVTLTGAAPAASASDGESTRAAPALHDDATTSAPAAADGATPLPPSAPPTTAPQPADASDVLTPAPAKTPDTAAATTPSADGAAIPAPPPSVDAANATAVAPPASQSPAPTPEAAQADVAPAPVAPPPPQSASAPPEADISAPPAAPRVEPRRPARPPTAARVVARSDSAARPSSARATANALPSARGAAELAAYRNALLARISGFVRYPEAARERGVTGVATVRFAFDGAGSVTLASLEQSSGDHLLDDEALAAVRRASPLPAPPLGAPRAYSAPIRFDLR